MIVKRFQQNQPQFRFEEDDGGVSGGDGDANAVITALDGGDGEGDPAPTPPPAPSFDYDALGKTLGSTLGEQLKGFLPKTEEKPLTAEEAMKELKFWNPDDAWFQQFGNLETQKQAVLAMRDGMTAQFFTILQKFVQERDQQITAKYDPIVELVRERENQAKFDRFSASYPQLANESLAPVISSVVSQLAAAKQLGKGESEDFKAIARGVEAVIKSHNPNFVLTAPAAGKTTARKPGTANAIPVTSSGAGGGGGNGGGGSKRTGNRVIDHLS